MSSDKELYVVEVLNDRELVVSGGEADGVTVDAVLLVVSAPRQVTNPMDDGPVGSVVEVKAVVRVYEAARSYALARTFLTEEVRVGLSGGIFSPPKYETRVESLADSVAQGDSLRPWDGPLDDVPSTLLA